jgi:MATE family multidrug resistance protein
MMAFAVGARRHHVREVRRTVRQALWATGLVCVPVFVALWHIDALFSLIGHEPRLAVEAADYVRSLLPTLLTGTWFIVLRSFMATYDRPRAALVIALLQVPVNGLINYALIFGNWGAPQLGLVGAGIGSSITGLMGLIALALVIGFGHFRRFTLFGRFWRGDRRRFVEVLRLGTPIGLTLTFEVMLFAGAAQLMGLISPLALAAHQLSLQLCAVTFMFALGLGQAAGIRIGIAAGARDQSGVGLTGWTALALGCGVMGLLGTTFVLFPQTLVGVFLPDITGEETAVVFDYARDFLILAALFQVVDAGQVVGANLLRGIKDTRVPMIYALVGYWAIGLTTSWALAFPLKMGGIGIWWGFVLALGLVAALMVRRFAGRRAIPAYRAAFGLAA